MIYLLYKLNAGIIFALLLLKLPEKPNEQLIFPVSKIPRVIIARKSPSLQGELIEQTVDNIQRCLMIIGNWVQKPLYLIIEK